MATVSPTAVHVCSDIRTAEKVGPGRWHLRDGSAKQTLSNLGSLQGVVAYAGIGAIDSVATSDLLAELLGPEMIEGSLSFDAFLEHARQQTDLWWKRNRASINEVPKEYRRHSLIVVGTDAGEGRIGLVSNYQALDGTPREKPLAAFFVTTSSWRPRTVILGLAGAVRRPERRLLKRISRGRVPALGTEAKPQVVGASFQGSAAPLGIPEPPGSEDASKVAGTLAWLNRSVADRVAKSGLPLISQGCTVTTTTAVVRAGSGNTGLGGRSLLRQEKPRT